jgi:hypothetical protein
MKLARPVPVNRWDLELEELHLHQLRLAQEQGRTRDLPANCSVPEVQACFRPQKVLGMDV